MNIFIGPTQPHLRKGEGPTLSPPMAGPCCPGKVCPNLGTSGVSFPHPRVVSGVEPTQIWVARNLPPPPDRISRMAPIWMCPIPFPSSPGRNASRRACVPWSVLLILSPQNCWQGTAAVSRKRHLACRIQSCIRASCSVDEVARAPRTNQPLRRAPGSLTPPARPGHSSSHRRQVTSSSSEVVFTLAGGAVCSSTVVCLRLKCRVTPAPRGYVTRHLKKDLLLGDSKKIYVGSPPSNVE